MMPSLISNMNRELMHGEAFVLFGPTTSVWDQLLAGFCDASYWRGMERTHTYLWNNESSLVGF